MKRTKIIATVGPATASREKLLKLYQAGVNVIRFNFSHANYEESGRIATIIHELNNSGETQLSLLLDTKGPEIRTGDLSEEILFRQGDVFNIYTNSTLPSGKDLFCDYPYLSEDMSDDGIIAIDSGLLNVKVVEKCKGYIKAEALNSAKIGSRRHVNLPGVKLRLPGITEKDSKDILWGIQNGVSFIAASFVRNAQNIKDIRSLLDSNGGSTIEICSKIENQEAIDNMDEIISESDGVMVARGDLGIEVPIEKLAVYQKEIVEKCNKSGTFSIVATHLLETMIDSPFPTRAESSDVFNAIMQQPDCLMLSGETAIGAFPIDTVKMMSGIIEEAEKHVVYNHDNFLNSGLSERDLEKKLLIRSGIFIGEELGAKALIIFTKSGKLARLSSFFRPHITTYAFTPEPSTVGVCNAYFGISPIELTSWDAGNYMKTLEGAISLLLEEKKLQKDDKVIVISDIQKEGVEIPIMKVMRMQDFL